MTQPLIPAMTMTPVETMFLRVGTQLAPIAWFCAAFAVVVVLALVVAAARELAGGHSTPVLRIVSRPSQRAALPAAHVKAA